MTAKITMQTVSEAAEIRRTMETSAAYAVAAERGPSGTVRQNLGQLALFLPGQQKTSILNYKSSNLRYQTFSQQGITLIPTYYDLNWCRLFKSIEIYSLYIQSKLNTFTIFGAEISSQYRPKVDRSVVEISGNKYMK